MKACFFASRQAYDCNDYKINLVAHSMGGLVSRYYIENLRQDVHVDKLITVDTPHWGSRYGDASVIPLAHKLCDHDLNSNSAMNHGMLPDKLSFGCTNTLPLSRCIKSFYEITDSLSYQRSRHTKYYAVAGIDHKMDGSKENDCIFEMPTNYTTYQQVEDFINTTAQLDNRKLDVQSTGDDLVGLLSQIGWKENLLGTQPAIPPIQMEKICIDVDKNGGNGPDAVLVELISMFHGKIIHRPKIMEKIYDYLEE